MWQCFEQVYAICLPLYFFGRIGPRAKAVVTRIPKSSYCRKVRFSHTVRSWRSLYSRQILDDSTTLHCAYGSAPLKCVSYLLASLYAEFSCESRQTVATSMMYVLCDVVRLFCVVTIDTCLFTLVSCVTCVVTRVYILYI